MRSDDNQIRENALSGYIIYETADQRLLLVTFGAEGADEAAVLDFLAGPLAAAPGAALLGGIVKRFVRRRSGGIVSWKSSMVCCRLLDCRCQWTPGYLFTSGSKFNRDRRVTQKARVTEDPPTRHVNMTFNVAISLHREVIVVYGLLQGSGYINSAPTDLNLNKLSYHFPDVRPSHLYTYVLKRLLTCHCLER